MDFACDTWYGWSTRKAALQVLLFFGQIRPGADPGRGKNRSTGGPLLQETSSSDRTGYMQQYRMHEQSNLETMWEEVLLFLANSEAPNFWRVFDVFLEPHSPHFGVF